MIIKLSSNDIGGRAQERSSSSPLLHLSKKVVAFSKDLCYNIL